MAVEFNCDEAQPTLNVVQKYIKAPFRGIPFWKGKVAVLDRLTAVSRC